MENLMKDIVNSDCVQELLTDVHFCIEEGHITTKEYTSICNSVQELLNNDETLLLEPLQIAMLIEDALIIHSAMRVREESKRTKHFSSPEKSVKVAFAKQFGSTETKTLC